MGEGWNDDFDDLVICEAHAQAHYTGKMGWDGVGGLKWNELEWNGIPWWNGRKYYSFCTM